MIRILQCVNNMHRAGLETMLMNYYRHIDSEKIQFDFLTHRPYRSDYDDEIERLGGKVYYAPRLYPQNYGAYDKWMKAFFQEHPEYKIIHSHIDAMSYLPLRAAKKAGVPVRIAHSHNTSMDKDFKYPLKQCFRFGIPCVATHYLACGHEAGAYLFGNKDFGVLPNAIETNRFLFNGAVRQEKRSELGIAEVQPVIGHVGRFSKQKNHVFLLQIFKDVLELAPEAVLLLIGTGELEQAVREQAKQMGIVERIRFLGSRNDVDALYQAMDAFVLPSLYEGVPVVGIEAQFATLPCIFSDKVPKEVAFSPNSRFISLKRPSAEWAQIVMEAVVFRRSHTVTCVTNSIYDICNASPLLEEYYLDLFKRECMGRRKDK